MCTTGRPVVNFTDLVENVFTKASVINGRASVCIIDANGFGRDAIATRNGTTTSFQIDDMSIGCTNGKAISQCLGDIHALQTTPKCSGISK